MRTCGLLLVFVLTFVTASATGPDPKYKAPRTPQGQPDLQGVWNFNSDVPLERPTAFADRKFFTREELAKQSGERESGLDSIAKVAPVEIFDRSWLDYRARIENLRTSLIAYPENGRLPKFVEGVQRIGGLAAILNPVRGTRPVRFPFGGIGADGPEDRGLSERCLPGPSPPFLPGFDSNYLQVFQTREHVVLLTDSDARIVPIDGRPHVGERLRRWSGDSRGHWEGDTLVVDTRHFNGLTQSFADAGTSREKVVTERFTRVSTHAIEYEATIVDPKTFEDRIVLSFPMAQVETRIYETACHEGNYSMSMTLAGARAQETAKAR